ncbi:MAG: hypothetical protein HYT97_09640 [Elusimicrobia bacterium]|nr:hypothetical protein [Elusimicrobiota bacterium]
MTIEELWQELQNYDETKTSKNFQLKDLRVQFYKGAMEIPLIAFFPSQHFDLNSSKMDEFSKLLEKQGLVLDCVTETANYKINTNDEQQYIGRITKDALKLHAIRIKELGKECFESLIKFFISANIEK